MESLLSFPQHRTPATASATADGPSATPTLPPRPGGLVEDTTLPYSTPYHSGAGPSGVCRSGACRLRLFVPVGHPISAQHPAVIIVTEQPEREGLSVTNGIEIIAATVCRTYGLNPHHTVLIEHYDDRERGSAAYLPGRIDGEKFSCVTFEEMRTSDTEPLTPQVRRPQWRPVSKSEIEALLGSSLP